MMEEDGYKAASSVRRVNRLTVNVTYSVLKLIIFVKDKYNLVEL